MKKILSHLPTVTPLNVDVLHTRNASAGLWLVILLPLACSPGLYETYSHCTPTPKLLALLAFQVGVSGIHLYHKFCLSEKQQNGEQKKPETSFLGRYVLHPYMPALITAVALSLLADISPAVATIITSICLSIMYTSTKWLLTNFPGSFTLGEGALLGQAAALSVTCSIYSLIQTALSQQQLSETQETSVFIQTAVLVVFLFTVGLYKLPSLRTPQVFVPYICLSGAAGVVVSSLIMGQWSPLWLFEIISTKPTRQILMAWWSGLTVLSVVTTMIAKRTNKLPTTILRKVYHVIIVLVFTPGIMFEPTLTQLASTAALMLCWILECVRDLKIEPLASMIYDAFVVFLDEKDTGSLILSHVYLLAGVAAPLWISPCPLKESPIELEAAGTLLPLLAGILAVGVGDTAASVGGTYFGKRHWFGTRKTVEGSLCGIVAQMLLVGLLVSLGMIKMSLPAWGRFFVSAIIVAIVEALTDQVDNIVLPLLMYTPLMDI
ncbi:dolichol kinase-like isoform X2 [Penaeus japonicus]|uniref:dolichol kinase-like isoform X2 n=1 Tax=Penaeus japonicus TaxID=27405 RepID=UPI001C7159FC|nr:dolichol kinase-like isoform X2 [Penaeus japonicus]